MLHHRQEGHVEPWATGSRHRCHTLALWTTDWLGQDWIDTSPGHCLLSASRSQASVSYYSLGVLQSAVLAIIMQSASTKRGVIAAARSGKTLSP